FQNSFENDLNAWSTFNTGTGATVSIDTSTASTGLRSVKLEQDNPNGDFSALIWNQPYDLTQSPIVAFDYMFPPVGEAPRFSMYFRYNGVLHQVAFTETNEDPKNLAPTYVYVGSEMHNLVGYSQSCGVWCVDHVTGDGRW